MSQTFRKNLIVLFLTLTFAASFSYAQTKEKKTDKKIAVTTFSVSGMTCSGCVLNVENKLKKINGVKDYKVNLKKNTAEVKYDPKKTSEKEITDIMNKTHYKFSKPKVNPSKVKNPSTDGPDKRKMKKENNRYRNGK